MTTSILQKVLDIPIVLSHLSEINVQGSIEYFTSCTHLKIHIHVYFMYFFTI